MKFNYTRRSSGYIALVLSLVTIKVFFEALLLGRGPMPGLSFLLYTLVFYIHYATEEIESTFVRCTAYIKKQIPIYKSRWDQFAPDTYISQVKGKTLEFTKYVHALYLSLNSEFKAPELSKIDVSQIRSSISKENSSLVESITKSRLDFKERFDAYSTKFIDFFSTTFTWIKAILNVLSRRIRNLVDSFDFDMGGFDEKLVTGPVGESSDDTT